MRSAMHDSDGCGWGGARPGSFIQPEQRVTDGAAIPGLLSPAHIEYVDDFGFIGVVDNEGIDESAVTLAAREAKTLLKAAGFGVHKESQSSHEEIIGGEFVNSWLLPHQKKLWSAVAMEIAKRIHIACVQYPLDEYGIALELRCPGVCRNLSIASSILCLPEISSVQLSPE